MERNYSTTEREALDMIYNITKSQQYLLGRKFTFHLDDSTLLYLLHKQALTGRLAWWMLLLQEFDFDIQHRPGLQHAVADYLSRFESREQEYNDLPDTSLFSINTKSTDPEDAWIIDMTHMLKNG